MINKTETEIMSCWKENISENNSPLVSITCVAYNHANYISETLNSFLMQETNFSFEILIHEDASTDNTKEIIQIYEKKFPNIIKPVYQIENKFSQGINPITILFKKVKGEFMAFCDGDDYWTDKYKLQIQIDEMKKYPKINMSCHYSSKLFRNIRCDDFAKKSHTKILSVQEIILGGGDITPTSSLVFRSKIIQTLPRWMDTSPFGDYPMQILGALNANALYIDKNMSIYRVGEVSSWTSQCNTSEPHYKRICFIQDFLTSINKITNGKFENECMFMIQKNNFEFIKNLSFNYEIRTQVFQLNQENFSLKQKILWHLIYKNITTTYSFHHIFKNRVKKFIQEWKVKKYSTINYNKISYI